MAFTVTKVFATVHGNQRVEGYEVTADAASGVMATGLGYINGVAVAPVSAATAGGKFKRNLDASSATANGSVFVSSVASGDVFFVTIFGR